MPGLSSVKSVPYHAGVAGGRPLTSRSFTARSSNPPAEAQVSDPLIGRKVWTRWPEDNHFYEAVITDYNPAEVCLCFHFFDLCTDLMNLI